MRVAILQCFHEANVFTPVRTGLRDFHSRYFLQGEAVRERFWGTKTWMGGILRHFDEIGAEVEIGVCTAALPGGTVDQDSFCSIRDSILTSLREIGRRGRIDITVLLLHGALAVEGVDDPEGELAAEVRRIIGPDCVLAAPLDFHANVGPMVAANVDIIVGGREYPHTDTGERGERLAELAVARLRTPGIRTFHFRLPIIIPMTSQATDEGPFAALLDLSKEVGRRLGLDDIGLLGGFPFADLPWVSAGLLVTCADQQQAASAFREVAEAVWEVRTDLLAAVPTAAEIAPQIFAAAGRGTVVVADVADNPGAGGPGDDVTLLRTLLNSSYPFAAGAIIDPAVAAQAQAVGEGGRLTTVIGGRQSRSGAGPLPIEATVCKAGPIHYRNTGPMMTGERVDGGAGAVLKVGAGYLLVATERIQAYDAEAFRSQSVPLHECRIILVKSTAHFRASFRPLATGGLILGDSLGWCSPRLSAFGYRRLSDQILPRTQLSIQEWTTNIDREVVRVCGEVHT